MKVEILTPDLSIQSKVFQARDIDLADVFQVVGSRKTQEGYEGLRRNVEAEGFKSPFNTGMRAVERHHQPANPTRAGQIYIYCPLENKCEVRTKINDSLWLKDTVSK